MKVAVVGATGLVGRSFLKLIKERNFPFTELKLFASQKNKGQTILFDSYNLTVQSLQKNSFKDMNIVFFSAGEHISWQWAKEAVHSGALVIDNSSAFRMQKDIPLVVPEINSQFIHQHKTQGRIIANPNCSTIQLVMALHPLHSAFTLDSVYVSSYQSLSGAGQQALTQLKEDSLSFLSNQISPLPENSFAFNCIPSIGTVDEKDGFCTEEIKIMQETKKILDLPDLSIVAHTVRVPTFNGHGETVMFYLKQAVTKAEILHIFQQQKGIKVISTNEPLLHQNFVNGKDDVYIGRIRAIPGTKGRGWIIWIIADNLRKGAALNGLQIAETAIQKSH